MACPHVQVQALWRNPMPSQVGQDFQVGETEVSSRFPLTHLGFLLIYPGLLFCSGILAVQGNLDRLLPPAFMESSGSSTDGIVCVRP